MHTTLASHGQHVWDDGLDALVDDAMFQIEHLLIEVEALHIKDRAKSSSVTEHPHDVGWPHD